jgi:hypothetical protein
MTFEVAGMYPSTTYKMFAQVKTGSKITSAAAVDFTTGALPKTISFPRFTVRTAGTDTTYRLILHNFVTFQLGVGYPDTATDLAGNIIWYYLSNDVSGADLLTRPLPGGTFPTLQDDRAWDTHVVAQQFLRQIDLAGNIVCETNMGVIQQELLAKGAVDGGPCSAITNPVVGSACAGAFHHDAIQTLPNGYTAALLDLEKIFPPGTQGDTSGKPVDIVGDMIVVLDNNWQVAWYWDAFDPAHGGNVWPTALCEAESRHATRQVHDDCNPSTGPSSSTGKRKTGSGSNVKRRRGLPSATLSFNDRHRGGGHPPTPATPPCIRVRTRRFESVTLTLLEQ